MAWTECKKCKRRIFYIEGRSSSHDGWCGDCYEEITGKCADCEGSGNINRVHLGVVECPRWTALARRKGISYSADVPKFS